jgi:hypothetical protein
MPYKKPVLLERTVPQQAVVAALLPSLMVLGGTAISLTGDLPKPVASSMGYFSSGVLLALLGINVLPSMYGNANTPMKKGGAAFGYLMGGALMLAMSSVALSESNKHRVKLEVINHSLTLVPENLTQGVFPFEAITSYLIATFVSGFLIGLTFQRDRNSVGLTVAATSGVQILFETLSISNLIEARGLPSWTLFVIDVLTITLVITGAYTGAKYEQVKATQKGVSAFFYYGFMGFVVAILQSYMTDTTSIQASRLREGEWYPPMWQYIGFMLLTTVEWTKRRGMANGGRSLAKPAAPLPVG